MTRVLGAGLWVWDHTALIAGHGHSRSHWPRVEMISGPACREMMHLYSTKIPEEGAASHCSRQGRTKEPVSMDAMGSGRGKEKGVGDPTTRLQDQSR